MYKHLVALVIIYACSAIGQVVCNRPSDWLLSNVFEMWRHTSDESKMNKSNDQFKDLKTHSLVNYVFPLQFVAHIK